MKLQLVGWVLLLFGMVAVAGAIAECDPEEGARWNQRYKLRGGEVYDNSTDLTWARCPVGMNWQQDSGCFDEDPRNHARPAICFARREAQHGHARSDPRCSQTGGCG